MKTQIIKAKNFKEVLATGFSKDEFKAIFFSAREQAENNHRIIFNQQIALLIAQIGFVISKALVTPKIETNTTLGSMRYLCKAILHDSALFDDLKECKINQNSNTLKHEDKQTDFVKIQQISNKYNRLINLVSTEIGYPELQNYRIKPTNGLNTIKAIDNNRSKEFCKVGKHRLALSLKPNFSYDPYSKIIKGTIMITCDDKTPNIQNDTFIVYLKNKNKSLRRISREIYFNKEKPFFLPITLHRNQIASAGIVKLDLSLSLCKDIEVVNKETRSYTTGMLWFKNEHSYTVDVKHKERRESNNVNIRLEIKPNIVNY